MKSPRKLTIVNETVYTGNEVEVVQSSSLPDTGKEEVEVVLSEESSSLRAKLKRLSLPAKLKRLSLSAKIKKLISARRLRKKQAETKNSAVMLPNELHRLRAACCHPQVGVGEVGNLKRQNEYSGTSVATEVLSMCQILDRLIDDAKVKAEEAQHLCTLNTNAIACLHRLKAESGSRGGGLIDSDVEMYLLQKSPKASMDAIDIADNNSSPFSKVAIVPTRLVPTKDSDHTGDNSDTDSYTYTYTYTDTDTDTYTDTDTDIDTDTDTDTYTDTDADTDTHVDVKVRWKMQLIRRCYHFILKNCVSFSISQTSQWELERETIRSDERTTHKIFEVDVGSNLLSYSCQCWSGPVVDDIFEYLLTI